MKGIPLSYRCLLAHNFAEQMKVRLCIRFSLLKLEHQMETT